MTDPVPAPRPGLDRRTVVTAAGWALPAIAAATAVPVAAASQVSGAVLSLSGGCVRYDADNPYGPGFEVTNIGTEPFTGSMRFQDFRAIGQKEWMES